MRSLSRNKQTIYYALYQDKVAVKDEYGNATGEYVTSYGTPTEFRINVSAARGTADVEQFGINAIYTKTMVTNDLTCPITETSRLWIGKPAFETVGEETTVTNHNYVVTAVAKSINSITYAIKEVVVS